MDRRRARTVSHGRIRGNFSSRYRRGVSIWLAKPSGALPSIARNRRNPLSALMSCWRLARLKRLPVLVM